MIRIAKTVVLACMTVLSLSLVPILAHGQPLPNLINVDLSVEVSFNPENGVYTYHYTVTNGPENTGKLRRLLVGIKTESIITPVPDPDLVNDESFDANYLPERTIPVGLESPFGWESSVSRGGKAFWRPFFGTPLIVPGETLGSFKINSKHPPGPRTFEIDPNLPFGDPNIFPEDCEINPDCPDPESFNVTGQTIGPVLAEELVLIDGKGQRSDVNAFLRYSNPTETTVTLPAGVKTFDLAVFYGSTIDPTSFRADFNREIITPNFTASPGGFSVVRLDLKEGRNTLVLSVDGVRSDGRTGRDTDRLTFIVPAP